MKARWGRTISMAVVGGLLLAQVATSANAGTATPPAGWQPHTITTAEAQAGMGPAGALAYEAPRACDNWYFHDGAYDYRLSHCTNPYFVQDVVKAHAKLHLYYRASPTGSWLDPASVDSLTINDWRLICCGGHFYRAPQSRGPGSPIADFYSAGIGINCGGAATTWNNDESVRLANGHPYYGPGAGTVEEWTVSPVGYRPC